VVAVPVLPGLPMIAMSRLPAHQILAAHRSTTREAIAKLPRALGRPP
jgi:hypothetical protein